MTSAAGIHRVLTFLRIATLAFMLCASHAAALEEGGVSLLPFSAGGSDAGGLREAGTVKDAVLTTGRLGEPASAYFFNGVSSSIVIPSVPARFTGDFAVSFWQRSAGATTRRMHAVSLGTLPSDNLDFDFNDRSGLWVFWNGGGGQGILAGRRGEYTDGLWHQILLQRSGSQVQLYVDGILKGSRSYSAAVGSTSLINLGKSSFGTLWWEGVVDDLRLYSRALSEAEIKAGLGSAGVHGAALTRDRFGEPDNAWLFDGRGSSIAVTSVAPRFTGDFAISFWQKSSGATARRMHAVSLGTLPADNLDFNFNGGSGLWVFWNGSGSKGIVAGKPGEYTDGFWHHILLQRVGREVQLYVDGILKGGTTYPGVIGTASLINLGKSSFGSFWWNGILDELRIYDRGLSEEEIAAAVGLVRLNAGRHGHIRGPAEVAPGETPSYTVTPDIGYRIEDVAVDGVSVGAVSSYSFASGITSPVVLSARFSLLPLSEGLLASYQFKGNASEAGGLFADATVNGAVLTGDRFRQAENAYSFDGRSSSISMTSLPARFTGDFAVSFWLKSAAAGTRRMHAASFGTLPSDNLDFDFNDRSALWVFWNGGGAQGISTGRPGELTDGSWHQVLLQRTGKEVQLYVDGVIRGSTSYAGAIGSSSILNLGKSSSGSYWWSGSIDDLRIYKRALAPEQVIGMMYQWIRIKPSNRNDGLVVSYSFNGNAKNDKGNGFDGVPHNVVLTKDRYGSDNRAYQFNGTDSFIDTEEGLSAFKGNFVIAFWQNSCSNSRMHAFSMGNYGDESLDLIFNEESGFKLSLGPGRDLMSAGKVGEFTDCKWHHVVVQRSGESIAFYVDALLKGTAADGSPIGAKERLRFGRSSAAPQDQQYLWNGALDDFLIYNRSFTPREITYLQHLQFQPRDGAAALSFKGKMWLLGGWNPAQKPETNSQVWSSSDGHVWELVANAPWEGRHEYGAVVFKDKMWVVGGDKSRGRYQNDVWNSEDGANWKRVTDQVPWADRVTHYALVFDDRIWVMGGQQLDAPSGMVAYSDVYYSSDGAAWTKATSEAGWSPRGQIDGQAVFQDRMWVIGGGTYDVRSYNNDVWNSSDGAAWQKVLDRAPWNPRQFHNVAVWDKKIWIMAGIQDDSANPGGSNDVWFSPDGVVWHELPETPWLGRHAASVVVFNNALWLIAGSSTAAYNDVWKLRYAP